MSNWKIVEGFGGWCAHEPGPPGETLMGWWPALESAEQAIREKMQFKKVNPIKYAVGKIWIIIDSKKN